MSHALPNRTASANNVDICRHFNPAGSPLRGTNRHSTATLSTCFALTASDARCRAASVWTWRPRSKRVRMCGAHARNAMRAAPPRSATREFNTCVGTTAEKRRRREEEKRAQDGGAARTREDPSCTRTRKVAGSRSWRDLVDMGPQSHEGRGMGPQSLRNRVSPH